MTIDQWTEIFDGEPRKFTDEEKEIVGSIPTCPVYVMYPAYEKWEKDDMGRRKMTYLYNLSCDFGSAVDLDDFDTAKKLYQELLNYEPEEA